MNLRLDPQEQQLLDDYARQLGTSKSRALMIALRQVAGKPPRPKILDLPPVKATMTASEALGRDSRPW